MEFFFKLLKNICTGFSTIWEDTYGCTDQYRYSTDLYLLYMLYHAYDITIECDIGAPGHGTDVVKAYVPLTKYVHLI